MLKIKKLTPLFNSVLVTGDLYDSDKTENGIIVSKKGDLKLYQTVLEVGSMVREIKPGDKIVFDPSAYIVMKYNSNSIQNDMDNNKVIRTNFPWVDIEGEDGKMKKCLLLTDRDIRFIYEGEEVWGNIKLPETPKIILPN
mgnify:CR=1 FL=1